MRCIGGMDARDAMINAGRHARSGRYQRKENR
jgi:hypothetical protein